MDEPKNTGKALWPVLGQRAIVQKIGERHRDPGTQKPTEGSVFASK